MTLPSPRPSPHRFLVVHVVSRMTNLDVVVDMTFAENEFNVIVTAVILNVKAGQCFPLS